MAHVSGPVSTLPGSFREAPKGTTCDTHSTRPAYRRVQGETDSFGAEYEDMCEECFADFQKAKQVLKKGLCEICHELSNDIKPQRDPEEGSCGQVYDVGACCRRSFTCGD